MRCVKDRIGRGAGHADRADGFTADAEDSLHEHRVGFDDRAFAGKYLDHRAIDVRLGFNGELRAPKQHLPRGGADALDGARGRRCDFLLTEAEDALRPRDDLTRRNLVADLHQQQIGKIGRLYREKRRNRNRNNITVDESAGDDVAGAYAVTELDQHIALHGQQSTRAKVRASRYFKSWRICLGHPRNLAEV